MAEDTIVSSPMAVGESARPPRVRPSRVLAPESFLDDRLRDCSISSFSNFSSHNQISCMRAFKMTKLLYPLIPPPSSVKMQASHGSSTSLAHDRPALSESHVSALRIRLELREELLRFSVVKGAGGARDARLPSMGSAGLSSVERKNAQGAAGRESRMRR